MSKIKTGRKGSIETYKVPQDENERRIGRPSLATHPARLAAVEANGGQPLRTTSHLYRNQTSGKVQPKKVDQGPRER
jgi:hypothetical protein